VIPVSLRPGADLAGFRDAARRLIAAGTPPEQVSWSDAPGLFGDATAAGDAPPLSLPRAAVDLARLAICHSDPERHALLYRLLWRLTHGEPRLLGNPADSLVHRLQLLAKAVRRDIHKMHAFVRFRRVAENGRERFVAWFEPEHHILDAAAPFFVDRFRALDWTILTPAGSLRWDGGQLIPGPPARREDAPASDAFEAGWIGYYESAFNPARVNPEMMRAEMPKKYWRNLPEAAAIPDLIRGAPARAREMIEKEAAMPQRRDPARAVAALGDQAPADLAALNRLIAASEPMVEGGTRAVLGEGPIGAPIAFVGEQPGDQEDLQGRPFVGPAGQMFDRALAEAGIDRDAVYVTNAVKHFKFVPKGGRRIHAKPTVGEIKHYRWWLGLELGFVAPRLTVALGVTALTALSGRALPLGANRGPAEFETGPGFVTVHPSYLLRLPDPVAREAEYVKFVADLTRVRDLAGLG
jgi:probable DNA metabolism protein